MERFANVAQTTLNGAINNSVTSVVVTSVALFPTEGNFRIIVDSEYMLVTDIIGSTFTVTRGIEGSVAASHSSGATVTHILTAGGLVQGILDNATGSTGFSVFFPAPGITTNTATTSTPSVTGAGYLIPFYVPGPMLLDKVGIQINTGGSGTVQWGLFSFTDPTICVKLAGGTGALSLSATYNTIAASGAPISINAGSYMLIVHYPTSNRPTVYTTVQITGPPCQKLFTSYVWSDTPDITNTWADTPTAHNWFLHGRLSAAFPW